MNKLTQACRSADVLHLRGDRIFFTIGNHALIHRINYFFGPFPRRLGDFASSAFSFRAATLPSDSGVSTERARSVFLPCCTIAEVRC